MSYPEGFHDWPLERRNNYFAADAARYLEAKQTNGASSPHRTETLPLAPAMPAARIFPIEALGHVLAGAAASIAMRVQCAQAIAAHSCLAVASLAAQRLADVRLPHGQTRPLSLYLITVAASGDRKSTADNEALRPVRMREKALAIEYQRAFSEWRNSRDAWAAQRRKIENERALDLISREGELSALGPEPIEPLKPLLTAPEPTVEALARHWGAMQGALGLFSAEGGQMTGGHGFGPDHRLKTAATLSTLWDGAGLRRLRAGDGVIDLQGRRLALHLLIQPDAAAEFIGDAILRDQGLLSRLLIASPESRAGDRPWREPPADDAAMGRYIASALELLERPAPTSNSAGNELTPQPLEFSQGARDVWVAFHDRIEAAMRDGGGLETIRDVASKAAENAARIAGVITIIENPDAVEIGPDALAGGCELMAWYLTEGLRLAGARRQSPAVRAAIRLLDWLKTRPHGEISRRDILRLGPNAVRLKADCDAAIAVLEDHNWLERIGEGRAARWKLVEGSDP